MSRKILIVLAALGLLAGLGSAFVFSKKQAPLPPAFTPVSNPYPKGIFATGIIESDQTAGANVNLYPEVAGPVTQLLVSEGETVRKGTALLRIDDSVQRPTVEQLQAQSEAALAALHQLKAQPRKETLEVAEAQVDQAAANLKLAHDQFEKKKATYRLDKGTISREEIDTAENTERVAAANLEVARKQFELMRAGAWEFDVRTQQHQTEALRKAYLAADAQLAKYVLRAPMDGVILSINVPVGGYVSPQGAYDTYTKGTGPILVMGSPQGTLAVRCYVDEILVHRLPRNPAMKAVLRFRGTDVSVPLAFVRTVPYVSPKVELSNQRTERVDVRVLPVLFRFTPPPGPAPFPGQLVDVFIEE